MGDRANVFVMDSWASNKATKEDGKPKAVGVYLYTHWRGAELPGVLANALASPEGRGRWDDGAYLARIIFDHMTGLTGEETGFGISASLCDNSYPILVIIPESRLVGMVAERDVNTLVATDYPNETGRWWTIEEFIERRPNW